MIGNNVFFRICYIVVCICLIILDVCINIYPRKNKLAQKITLELKEYKVFLKKTDVQTIEALMKMNTEYFYNNLPYTYFLNVQEEFVARFGMFVENKPDWFVSENNYNAYEVNIIVNNIIEELYNQCIDKVI